MANDSFELMHFDNVNTLDEPLFESPMGTLNIKQLAITGLGCMIIAVYAMMEMQLAVIPLLIIPIWLGMGRRGNLPMDEYLPSWLMFKIRGSSTKMIKNIKKEKTATTKKKNTALAMKVHSKSKTVTKIKSKNINRQIQVTRINETVHIRLNCSTIDGEPLKNRAINVFLDNEMVFNYSTNSLGQLVANIPVNELGKKKLRVMAKNIEAPIIEGSLDFVLRGVLKNVS